MLTPYESLATYRADNLAELLSQLREIKDAANAANQHESTVYLTEPLRFYLDELTLSDGSKALNIRLG